MVRRTFKTAILSLLLANTPVFALQSDNRQPAQIGVDRGSLDQAKQVTHFNGSVIIKQSTLNLHATNVHASRNDKDGQLMATDDSPIGLNQMLDDSQGVASSQANNAEYSSATGIIRLTGSAKAQRGDDVAQSTVIIYSMRTEVYNIIDGGKFSAKANTESGRVSVITQLSSTQKK